ncbi:MAG: hypothetical protein GY953_22055, partial [bacterium]|nr:hypothetical protein [bacterium]
PEAIAAGLQRQDQPTDREVTIHPTVGVGYESGDRYDPTYGRRRGGWTTSVGVGVGVGNAPPVASTPADHETMEIELHEKGLPEGVTTKPVAGYLYFPAPKRYRRTVPWTLEYNGLDERVKVDLKR